MMFGFKLDMLLLNITLIYSIKEPFSSNEMCRVSLQI